MIVKEKTKKHSELILFFFFLTTSLFLGDGKQPFVDAWWALGILMMYGVRYYRRGKLDLRPLPRFIGWAWAALILYSIILTPFSDSAGYSITATIRLIEAYLAYLLFHTISSTRVTALFIKGLLFVGVVATLASFVFLLSPALAGFLPPMNLLYATYGHNHLADLLLMIFPIVITQSSWLPLIFFTAGMLLTFARGAWILLILYLLFLVVRSKDLIIRRVGLSVAAATIAVFLLISLVSVRGIPQKPSLLEDGRWEYWRQAIEAIKERPLFGSGPGTFYLESKRLQSAPSSYSWFAHSFPLQITAETGVVGLAIFSFLLWSTLRRTKPTPLLRGTILVLAYSLYEFTLDYTVMWLLVWSGLGALTKHNIQPANGQRRTSAVGTGALIVLALFYASSVGSVAASVFGRKDLAFFLAPYDTDAAKEFLGEPKTSVQLVTAFHRKNPEVLKELTPATKGERGLSLFEQALWLDPQNTKEFKRYLQFVVDNGLEDKARFVGQSAVVFGKTVLPRNFHEQLEAVGLQEGVFLDAYTKETIATLLEQIESRLAYSKFFYLVGLHVMSKDPKATFRLWRLSRDLAPWWAHYHLELASLAWYVLKERNETEAIIKTCLNNKYLKIYCEDKSDNPDLLPQPGSLKEKIMAIPSY